MRALRLTEKQARMLLSVANWGKVFVMYHGYDFIADKGLARKASPAELAEHYDGLRADLIETTSRLRSAVECQNWAECSRLSTHGLTVSSEIESRAEDEKRLWALNDAGRAYVDRILAKQEKS